MYVLRTDACKVLIQNAIVLWNTLFLSQQLSNTSDVEERAAMLKAITSGSLLTWLHVNLQGEYDFRRRAANDSSFDMAKILALKLAGYSKAELVLRNAHHAPIIKR